MSNKHIAASGEKAGKWVACTAKVCRNGGLHVDNVDLNCIRHHLNKTSGKSIQIQSVPLKAVEEFNNLSDENRDALRQSFVEDLKKEGAYVSGENYDRFYEKETPTIDSGHGFVPFKKEGFKREVILSEKESIEESKRDLFLASEKEKAAVVYFSTENYFWVNEALYEGKKLPSVKGSKADFRDGSIPTMVESVKAGEKSSDVTLTPESERTQEFLKEAVNTLDSVMMKSPKDKERIVYKGMRFGNDGIENARVWVDKNMVVGGEVTFDGYQSTSLSYDVANNTYADNDDAVIFEIKTSEGVNISSLSSYPEEQEVLLPRNSTYKVVGKTVVNRAEGGRGLLVQLVAVSPPKSQTIPPFNNDSKPEGWFRKLFSK